MLAGGWGGVGLSFIRLSAAMTMLSKLCCVLHVKLVWYFYIVCFVGGRGGGESSTVSQQIYHYHRIIDTEFHLHCFLRKLYLS
jgi:hypothetical protein